MRRRDLERRLKRAEEEAWSTSNALSLEQKASDNLRRLLDQQEKRHDEALAQYAARCNAGERLIDRLVLLLAVTATYVEATWIRDRIDKALRDALVSGGRADRLMNLIEEKKKEVEP